MENQNNTTILPLYQQVRQTMYDDFESLKRQNAIVQTCTKANLKYALMNYREKYLKFYFEINSEENLKKLEKEEIKYLNYYSENLDKIKKSQSQKLTKMCRCLLDKNGVMKIGYTKKDPGKAILGEY